MEKIKVQFIGINNIPKNKDDETFKVRKIKWLINHEGYSSAEDLSFHDYNIVFINYPKKLPYPSEPTGFMNYIYYGGIVVLFLGPSEKYPWWDELLGISVSKGDSVVPNPDHWLKTILRKYPFVWYCLIEQGGYYFREEDGLNLHFENVGTAVSGKCVSSIIHYGNGKLILLPILEKIPEELIRELIDGIKKNYFKSSMILISEPKPQWIDKWNLQPELKLKDEMVTLENEMHTIIKKADEIKKSQDWYGSLKRILYSQGKELSFSIHLILKEMGFVADLKEDEGRQDIEIKFNSFFAIVEAKGLKGYANNSDLRQLLDYYVTTSETYPEVKGIFIVNHFRDKEPSERGTPYSQGAMTLAERNAFCLLTTVDLFKMYNLLLDSKITINQIIDLFQTTKGLCDIEKLM
jgi:hypothetical protein